MNKIYSNRNLSIDLSDISAIANYDTKYYGRDTVFTFDIHLKSGSIINIETADGEFHKNLCQAWIEWE